MNFLSLFSGIGGLDLGLERAGMRSSATNSAAACWPDVPRFDDATKFCRRVHDCLPENENGEVICPRCGIEFGECECIGVDQFTNENGIPDLIAGGDPCQTNSNARTSERATAPPLGGEFIRIVEQLCPKFVLRENPSAVRADAPWPWWRFRSELVRLGYAVCAFRLRACCVGADIRRDRLFLFAEHQSAKRQGLEGHEREVMAGAIQRRQDADAAGPNRWNATPRICRAVDGIPNRVDRLRSLGNAVVPAVGEWIGRRILLAATGGAR
jgi:DNA (cytosine-5)-methyltransferase 1